MATDPTRKQREVHGIAFARPPRWSISRVCDGVDDRAGTEEEQGLEQGVVPDMQQAAAQAEDDPIRAAQRTADQGQAEAHDDDADVLDAVVGEQPLQVVLADGKGDPEDARDHAQRQDDRPIPAAGSEAGTSPASGRRCPS